MAQITIVGLGPGAPEHITREAWDVLTSTREVWVRTLHHPVLASLPESLAIHSFDALYEAGEMFEDVYAAIAKKVFELGHRGIGILYAVPGHPMVGESAVFQILDLAHKADIPVRLVSGLSFIEPTLIALKIDALDGLQVFDALDIARLEHPPLNPDAPALVAQVYSSTVASDLKLALMNQYPDEHQVALIDSAGTMAQSLVWAALYEIDRCKVGPLTSLYIPSLPPTSSFEGFQATIARLRSPDGCPWDREQTHATLRSNLLEETYEVLSAIDKDDSDALCEELGDLLLQVVLHAQIAAEYGEFQMAEVIAGIDKKLKRRHPHVWGNIDVDNTEEVCVNWEAIKRAERDSMGKAEHSLLDGVPKALPALLQAYAYGNRVSRVGFDWREITGVITKVREELAELESAPDADSQAWEIGDVLFAIANWARWLDIDPESALREANLRFARRFHYIEDVSRERNIPLEEMTLEELDHLWDEAKNCT